MIWAPVRILKTVSPRSSPTAGICAQTGFVTRMAKDGSWADVRWGQGWRKRMPTSSLVVQHTIERGGWKITDITRQRQLHRQETTR